MTKPNWPKTVPWFVANDFARSTGDPLWAWACRTFYPIYSDAFEFECVVVALLGGHELPSASVYELTRLTRKQQADIGNEAMRRLGYREWC